MSTEIIENVRVGWQGCDEPPQAAPVHSKEEEVSGPIRAAFRGLSQNASNALWEEIEGVMYGEPKMDLLRAKLRGLGMRPYGDFCVSPSCGHRVHHDKPCREYACKCGAKL